MKQLTTIAASDYLDRIDFDPAIIGRTLSTDLIKIQASMLAVRAEQEDLYLSHSEMVDALVRIRNNGGVR